MTRPWWWLLCSGPLLWPLLLVSVVGAEDDLMRRAPWAACEYCHGRDGRIDSPEVPAIAAQSASYIEKQLTDFCSGRRVSPKAQMRSAVLLLDTQDDATVARHFADQAPLWRVGPTVAADDPGAQPTLCRNLPRRPS